MAITDLGMMGTVGNTTANQNNLVCTTSTAGAVAGNLVICCVSVDNRVSGGGDDLSVSGVTDSGGNTWTKARQNATNLAAQAGTSVSVWYSIFSTTTNTSSTVTAAFTTNTTSDAQCMAVRKFAWSRGSPTLVGTAATTSSSGNPGSLDVTTTNAEHLRIRAIGCEYDSTQTLTVTSGGWAAFTEAASASSGTTAEQVLEVEWIITSGTNVTSGPTLASSCDNSSVYVAFIEGDNRGSIRPFNNVMQPIMAQ